MTLLLGIDVGWSVRRRSCALAISGPVSQSQGRTFKNNVSVGLYQLEELLKELDSLVRKYRKEFATAVLVIDGPVGPRIDAVPERAVDVAFSIGGFRNRAPAYPITQGSGLMLSETTSRILHRIDRANSLVRPWLGGVLPTDGLIVVETNPTPAMALLFAQQDVSTLPSRTRPKYINGTPIRAKSDWYWRLGAARYAARVLRDDAIGTEVNHERVAGLFALALASGLASREGSSVVALGDGNGVYLVPATIDATWEPDVRRIGIAHGDVVFAHSGTALASPEAIDLPIAHAEEAEQVERPLDVEDPVLVVLNDNGGLNTAANPWLAEIRLPCQLQAGRIRFTVEAAFGGRSDMFRITPSAKNLAKHFGFVGDHLSKNTPVAFEAMIGTA